MLMDTADAEQHKEPTQAKTRVLRRAAALLWHDIGREKCESGRDVNTDIRRDNSTSGHESTGRQARIGEHEGGGREKAGSV